MKQLIFSAFVGIILIFTAFDFLNTQTHQHPWYVIDNGGGKSTGGELLLYLSMGQPSVQKMTYLDTGMVLEGGFLPGLRNISGTYTTVNIIVSSGWNMISVPLRVNDLRKSVLFPDAVSSAYGYFAGYQVRDTLKNGIGYWLKFPLDAQLPVVGTGIISDTIDVNGGWNIIGTISYPLLLSDITPIPPLELKSQFFGYSGTGYYTEDTLKPGFAYWLKVNQSGKIIINGGSVLKSEVGTFVLNKANVLENIETLSKKYGFNKLIFKCTNQQERTLYFTDKSVDVDLDKYELPPVPPSNVLDVRFKSQRNLEYVNGEQSFDIRLNGIEYPMNVSYDIKSNDGIEYNLVIIFEGDKGLNENIIELRENSGEIVLGKELIGMKLIARTKKNIELPEEYALYQNYPNPFNPTTKIRYDLPVSTKVKLTIYNVLGQELVTLVDEMKSAGRYSAEWNTEGFGVASGLYFVKMQAGSFTDVKKMILMR
ncbi:MAG: Cell surface protein [Ignavibacteriae bacterium]|nr:MAG: Cell surface protein [Ignavibacteriota bacterium]